MSTGKLLAQTCHCSEAYWTQKLRKEPISVCENGEYSATIFVPKDIFEQYVCGMFTKTVCEAKSKNHLLKARDIAEQMELIENEDYGLIYDKCLTELEPEEPDGTTLTGIWFRPLPDEQAHIISKKFHLYV